MLIAVKPQMMGDALPAIAAMGNGETLFVSVAAGTPIAAFEAALGAQSPIVRAMPNTPAAVGRGITAIIGNDPRKCCANGPGRRIAPRRGAGGAAGG